MTVAQLAMNSGKKRSHQEAPFLQDNWLNGVNSALRRSAMGGSLSTPKQQQFTDTGLLTTEESGGPPTKRRRMSTPDSLIMEDLIASPGASDTRRALRIEVFKILHKDSKKVRVSQNNVVPRDILTTKGRCRITVYDTSTDFPQVLHCDTLIGTITTYKNPVGPHRVARIDLPRAFYVPEENILINRADDDVLDFPEACKLVVELEGVAQGQWPPLESHDLGIPVGDQGPLSDLPKRHWTMFSEFTEIFGRARNSLQLTSFHRRQQSQRSTDYVMDVDLRWTSGFRALKRIEKGSLPCITAIDPEAMGTEVYTNGRFEPNVDDELNGLTNGLTNGINGHLHEDSFHEADDDMRDGDQTPSRSLRVRQRNKVYNLKVLSDQAQGRERKRRARAGQVAASEGRVTYFLPTDQPVALDCFRCIACGAHHNCMNELQLHLQTCHSDYECLLEMTSQGPQFRISSRLDPVSLTPSKTFRLARPVKAFYVESWTSGDHSYEARLTDTHPEAPRSPARSSTSRQLFGSKAATPVQQEPKPPKKRKILIPETGQPIFDPVSKARLKPGDELPKAPKDNDWLIHKHRENIAEFSDITPAEKEYVYKWDAFILQEHLTSSAYFPNAWVRFIRNHASWLAGHKERMLEFAKHSSYLLARDLLDDNMINVAFGWINAERKKNKSKTVQQPNGVNCEQTPDATPSQSPRASQLRRNKNGCAVCQLPVLGPRMLLCSNKGCSHRLYHSDCIQDKASTPVSQPEWLCNTCSDVKEVS